MSTFRRLASGAAASWARIGVTLLTQILLVPIYLRHWSAATYGTWLAIFALLGFVNLLSAGFQNYVGNEFLQLAHRDRTALWSLFARSLKTGLVIAFAELTVVSLFVLSGIYGKFIPVATPDEAWAVAITLIAYSVVWSLSGSVGGVCVRLLTALGHFSRLAWWGVASGLVIAISPLLGIINGGGLKAAGLATTVAVIIYNIPFLYDVVKLLKREGMTTFPSTPGWAWREASTSLALMLRGILEMLRQQGVRLLLAPLAGTTELAAFATMRTGANVALQGIGSITQPLLPELMRFLHQRDQQRSEGAFASIWLVVAFVLAPGVLVLQAVAPGLYDSWTLGRLAFDPLLFAVLSAGVLVFACAQPAVAIVQGHNLIRPQLFIMGASSLAGIGGMVFLVPLMGIRGAGWALLAAELLAASGYTFHAARWMEDSGLRWPRQSQAWMIGVTLACALGLLLMAVFPRWLFTLAGSGVVVVVALAVGYWRSLPVVAKARLTEAVSRLNVVVKNRE